MNSVYRRLVPMFCLPLFAACDSGGAAQSDATSADATTAPDGDAAGTQTSADTTTSPDAHEGAAPVATSVTAHVAGARGHDLDLVIVGTDADKDIADARVRVYDAGGQDVMAFRTTLEATADSNESLVSFSEPVAGKASVIAHIRIRDLMLEHPEIASVDVALHDAAGHFSDDASGDVVAQVVKQLGDACDKTAVADRCADGLGCRGTPSQCQDGLASEITKLAYLKGEGGTRIVVQGTDPEDDLLSLKIEFLDNAGKPLLVDLDNDETPESQEFEVNAAGQARDGAFVVRVVPAAGFELMVPQVAVTATDAAGHEGARKTAKLAPTPVRGAGAACDVNGFDVCNATSVCSPGVPNVANTCKAKAQLATAECASAPSVDVAAGTHVVSGIVAGPSVWDAPASCSSGDPTGRPETAVVLHLENDVAHLTLSTEVDGTNFDTVLYVVPGCTIDSTQALGCADDAPSGAAAASLELELVPAGDYLVIVDSWGPDGGSYALSVTAE
ncbi:MAG: hypothetical protein U1F43_11695 [Myxococcota bacterium]